MTDKEKAYITIYVDKNPTEEDARANPEKIVIDKLAEVVSYLESRITHLEECLAMKPKKRGIIVKYKDNKEGKIK